MLVDTVPIDLYILSIGDFIPSSPCAPFALYAEMHLSATLSLLVLAISAAATSHSIHERRELAHPHWFKQTRLSSDHILPISIALKQQNLDRADELVNDVAHPDSPNYGKHWSAKEVIDTFAPSVATVKAVKEWLTEAGITEHRLRLSPGRNWIKFDATVEQAEDLLRTEYYLFQHASEDKVTVACDSYSVPSELKNHIDLVTPTIHLNLVSTASVIRRSSSPPSDQAPRQHHSPRRTLHYRPMPDFSYSTHPETPFTSTLNCSSITTPICLRALYGFPPGSTAIPGNSLGIAEFTPQNFAQRDLNKFYANLSAGWPRIPQGTAPTVISIDGGAIVPNATGFNIVGESNQDISYGTAIVYPQSVTVFQAGDPIQGASINNLLDAFDSTYCTFEGGDVPGQDGIYPDTAPGGFNQSETVSRCIPQVKRRRIYLCLMLNTIKVRNCQDTQRTFCILWRIRK